MLKSFIMAKAAKTAKSTEEGAIQESTQGVYEKWRVEPKSLGGGKYELTAIQLKLDNVKIGAETADLLNEQSHNSKIHYFKKGEVTNGDKITIQR